MALRQQKTTVKIYDEQAGGSGRHASEKELAQFMAMGYDMSDPRAYFLKISNSPLNNGRMYWSYKYAFLGFADEVPRCNQKDLDWNVERSRMTYRRYLETQTNYVPMMVTDQRLIDLKDAEIEELREQLQSKK